MNPVLQTCCHIISGVPDTVVAAIGSAIVVSIFGVIGYWVKAFFDRKSQKEIFDRDNRRQVYETYLMSFVAILNCAPDSDEELQAKRSYVESRMKIILLGSENLMVALNDFNRFSGQDSPETWDSFRKVALQMRSDFNLKSDASVEAFSKILFAAPTRKSGGNKSESRPPQPSPLRAGED